MNSDTSIGIRVTPEEAERYAKLPMREQYAILMALGDPKYYQRRYERALKDFEDLIALSKLTSVGINWEYGSLVLGTEEVTIEDADGIARLIGDIVIVILQSPARFCVHNLGGGIGSNGTRYAHPHAQQDNEFCMGTSKEMVKLAIVDGECAVAANMLLAATWMQLGRVEFGSPFHSAALPHWPRKEKS